MRCNMNILMKHYFLPTCVCYFCSHLLMVHWLIPLFIQEIISQPLIYA